MVDKGKDFYVHIDTYESFGCSFFFKKKATCNLICKTDLVKKVLYTVQNDFIVWNFLKNDNFCLQYYLEKSIPNLYKKGICKIKLSSHNLFIETWRHKNIPRDKRFCKTCIAEIEDEYNCIPVCLMSLALRPKLIKSIFGVNHQCTN